MGRVETVWDTHTETERDRVRDRVRDGERQSGEGRTWARSLGVLASLGGG